MPPRSSRTSQQATFALKTDLQIERDHYGYKIGAQWQPQDDRPNMEPRDIALAPGANTYYQHVVHHALMHTPIFVQWILSHNQPAVAGHDSAQCIMCAYKSLAWDYWLWNGHGGGKIVAATHAGLTLIEHRAVLALGLLNGLPDAAGVFYEWVTDQMEYAVPAVLPADQRYKVHWNNEFKALFQVDMSMTRTCQNQGCENKVATPLPPVRSIEVDFDPAYQNLGEMLDDYFDGYADENYLCTRCNVNGIHRVQRTIRAAPQVLRIRVNIADMADDGTPIRYLDGWEVPEELHLRFKQECDGLPLDYMLSSSIAHGEDAPVEEGEEEEDTIMTWEEPPPNVFDEDDEIELFLEIFDVTPERVDSAMGSDEEPLPGYYEFEEEEEEDDEDDELFDDAEVPRDLGVPHLIPRDVAGAGASRRSPELDSDDEFNGLILVTNEEFNAELGPSIDEDMDELAYGTDNEDVDEDEDMSEEPEHLNRREQFASPPPQDSDEDILGAPPGDNNGINHNSVVGEDGEGSNDEHVFELHADMYDSDEESIVPESHYILNVRGPEEEFHISMAHHDLLDPLAFPLVTLPDNPQDPWHMPCHNPQKYQVVTLMYTRKALDKKWRKLERNIPSFI